MKFNIVYIALFLLFCCSPASFGQNKVVNRNGKEIEVNTDATTTSKGIVKLAGDLGGTADAPTVPALSNKIEGNGTINYVPKFTATKTLGNSLLFDDGTNMGIGTILPSAKLEINSGISGTSGLKFTNLTSANTPIINSKFLSLDASGNVIYATYLTSLPLITANGINSSTTEVRDYNVWANRGNGFYITDVGGPIANPIPNNPAWFTLSQVAKESSFYGQTALSDLGFWFRGGDQATIGSNNWRKTISLNANSRFDIGWGASDNAISINNVDNGPMLFATNDSEKMRILPNGNIGIGNIAPANKLEITQGTAGNSGLRFTNLNSASTATTSSSKVLGLNSSGDVILTNVPGTQNIVDFSTATPTTSGVVFTPDTPADESVVYQSAVDNSMWTYNGSTYVTYNAPASTAWYTAGTTNDAGNSKTSNIFRTGNVGIGTNNPSTKLHLQGITTSLGANANAPMLRMSRPTWSGYKWGSAAQFNLGTYDDGVSPGNSKSRLDIALTNGNDETTLTNVMTWLGNGNVGIGTTAPANKLEITQGTAGNSGLRFTNLNSASTASTSSSKVLGLNSSGDVILTNVPGTQNIVDFSTATPTTSGVVFTPATPADQSVVYQSAVDNSMWTYNGSTYVTYTAPASTAWYTSGTTNDAGNSKTSNIYRTGNVGVGTNAPSAPLVVQANAVATGVLKLAAPSVAAGDNWWMGFSHGNNNSPDSNDRARIGVDIAAGGSGRLFFTTGASGSQTRALFIDESQRVGIGTSTPTGGLTVFGAANSGLTANILGKTDITKEIVFGKGGATKGLAAIAAVDQGGYGGGLAFFTKATGSDNFPTSAIQAMNIDWLGNVGIGTTAPGSKLEVNGSATNTKAYNSGSATAILFNNSNLAYTSASPGSFSLQGIKDGGTYTLAVQGTTAGTSNFLAVGFTLKSINNGPTIAGKQTLYTFIVMGTTVYYYMATGF